MARHIIINNESGSAAFETVFSITVLCLVIYLMSQLTAFFISSHKALIMADGAINERLVGTSDPCLETLATGEFGERNYTFQLPDEQVGWGDFRKDITPSSTVTFVVNNICN